MSKSKPLASTIKPTRALLAGLPKIEVHRHLEGTYPIEVLFKMSMKNRLDVPKELNAFKKAFQFPKNHPPDFLLFLSKFKKFWYKDLEDVRNIAYSSVKSFAADSLHYIELRFNPLHFSELTGLDPKDVTRTIISAGNIAAEEINLQIRYLLTFNRGVQTANEMIWTYKDLKETGLPGVVGIDLAGDEINYPPNIFVPFFDLIKKDGSFGIDIHAGEAAGPESMWVAIDQLHADRIGHGVAAIKDANLQEVLKKKNIFLAQCITSNYQTGAWKVEKTHPIDGLIAAGVPINISSDDPTIQDTILTDDYAKIAKNFGWTLKDFINSNVASVETCFLSKRERAALKKSYLAHVSEYLASKGILG